MTIRDLASRDIPEVITLGGMMHEESQYRDLCFYPKRVIDVCRYILDDDQQLGLIAETNNRIVGMLAGYLRPYEYGDAILAHDRLVYVRPGYRGSSAFIRLVRRYVSWAREMGAEQVFLSQSTAVASHRVHGFYRRLGFEYLGSIARMICADQDQTFSRRRLRLMFPGPKSKRRSNASESLLENAGVDGLRS